MNGPACTSFWATPNTYLSLGALAVSLISFLVMVDNNRKTKRRVEFIEYIAGEFAKIDAALDMLEITLQKAKNTPAESSQHVLVAATTAMRVSNRSLIKISKMPAVSVDLVKKTNVDEIDEILTMADEASFEGPCRTLKIETALNIVSRVAAKCASAQHDIQSKHL